MVVRAMSAIRCSVTLSMSLFFICGGQTLDWAPVGAMWYYSVGIAVDIPYCCYAYSYVVFRVEKDTMFDSYICKKIIIDEGLTPLPVPYEALPYADDYHPFALTRISNDSIYFFNWQCNRWEFVASNNFNFIDTIP